VLTEFIQAKGIAQEFTPYYLMKIPFWHYDPIEKVKCFFTLHILSYPSIHDPNLDEGKCMQTLTYAKVQVRVNGEKEKQTNENHSIVERTIYCYTKRVVEGRWGPNSYGNPSCFPLVKNVVVVDPITLKKCESMDSQTMDIEEPEHASIPRNSISMQMIEKGEEANGGSEINPTIGFVPWFMLPPPND
jgi:hypothetical protein